MKNQRDAEKVEKIISPYKSEINLKILQGTYNFRQLMKWKKELNTILENKAGELGVRMLDIDDTKNILEIGVNKLDGSTKEAITKVLQKKNIPLEAVNLVEISEPIIQESRSSTFDPLIGGIKIDAWNGGSCTIGFTATKDGVKGIVTAGHCYDVGEEVYQPSKWYWWKKIGTVASNPPGPRYSDSSWTPVSRNINYKVYPNYDVSGKVDWWRQEVGDYICKGGISTDETCGRITRKCFTMFGVPEYGTLYCQFNADYNSASGDSGGPVYIKHGSSAQLYGIHWGRTGSTRHYSPVNGVFGDLGWMTIS